MSQRRLVGIDLGIASAHTVRVLREDGSEVCRRRCEPTRESLEAIERAGLADAAPGTRLEVVMEPTGPAWRPVASFFQGRGHLVYRVSSAKSADLRHFLSRHAKSNGIDAETLARLPLMALEGLQPLILPTAAQASLDRRVRTCHRLTREMAKTKVRIKALTRELLPVTPLEGELSQSDLAILEKTGGDPRRLRKLGVAGLTRLATKVSARHLGEEYAGRWLEAATRSLELYDGDPSMAYEDHAAEIMTEVALLGAYRTQLALHEKAREAAYLAADPKQLARSLPGVAEVGGPVLTALVGEPSRFPSAAHFRSFTGLAPRASETGNSDRKGQPMSKAGPQLLRTSLIRAADTARRLDPQLAHIYYKQMTASGAPHLKALCVVASHLAERLYQVLRRGTPYVLRDLDGNPVTAEAAKALITEHWTVPEEVRRKRRSKKGRKAPQQFPDGNAKRAHGANTRRPSSASSLPPSPATSRPRARQTHVPA